MADDHGTHPARHEGEEEKGALPDPARRGTVESSSTRDDDDDDDALDAVEERGDGDGPARPPRKVLREILAMVGTQWGPPQHPLAEKITAEHITTMLEIDRERVKNQREDERDHRKGFIFLFCAFFVFVLITLFMLLWSGNDELTEKVLIGVVTSVASGLGGYGLGKSRSGS
jgi:hypothetical protein